MAPPPSNHDPGRVAIGTWSAGRFMHFGEAVDDERFVALVSPDERIDTVITADVYGTGAADEMLGRAIAGRPRESMCVVGAVGHDFYEGERNGPKGFPRFTDPALRDAGLTRLIGVAPGPANGFTLDVIDCLERFGDRIDWAMVILNPLEPWPGELCLDAAAAADVKVITRVVDYGGLFFDDLRPGQELVRGDHRGFRPPGWLEAGLQRIDGMRPIAERAGLTMIQLACQWNLAHRPVECVAPTLIQEVGPGAKSIEDKRAELAALPEQRLTHEDVDAIRALGDNTGCMALKGASPQHTGEEQPDRWTMDDHLATVAERWRIDPQRDLVISQEAA